MWPDVPGVCLGVSVEFENSLVVARVVAAGVGYVGESRLAGRADDEVTDGCAVGGQVPGPGFLRVLAEGDVADVVAASGQIRMAANTPTRMASKLVIDDRNKPSR